MTTQEIKQEIINGTLGLLKAQELFNSEHRNNLIEAIFWYVDAYQRHKYNRKSVNCYNICAYLNHQGNRCAVGCLFNPVEREFIAFSNGGILAIMHRFMQDLKNGEEYRNIIENNKEFMEFLSEFQKYHDNSSLEDKIQSRVIINTYRL